ncbi:MAG: hypothetical protein AUG44_08825 [Actinobacteria bacterium 13_1_20CM_3_71_11]|nr:MAG: hypothetical protein AUG44_08825 [Actinobacteria bacterium 13_1_20CM_3_71_11]
MHAEALSWFTERAGRFGGLGVVVDVGGRNINGGLRHLFPAERYTGIDLHPGPDVDVVCDIRAWVPGELADVVLCAEVLEHADDGEGVVAACRKLLKPGGVLLLSAAAPPRAPHSGIDGGAIRDGEYYGNVEPDVLRGWLSVFSSCDITYRADVGDVYAEACA